MKERDLFLAALEIDDLAARRAHLQAECAGDAELLARVESLLASHEGQSQFLNTPAVEQIADGSEPEIAATILAGKDSTEDEDLEATKAFHSNGPEAMTEHQDDSDDEIPLGYLEPSSKPGSIGRLAHYEVLNVIGSGAFGTVLRAFDEKLQRVVAIKVMAPEMAATSPARKRFLREAQASAAIRHEHVVSIYAVEEKPIPYLVMEYIPGLTLQQRLDERGPLDILTVLRIGRQIAEGLAAAHAQELIHRDIKPGNILLESSVLDRVKITDFGLARAADDASLTQSGTIAGTPMYMAPEQALGKKLDQRADLFSFGSVLYQMVSGRPPFRANGTLAVLKRVTEDTPRQIREIIPEAPQWLCDIITKLHAKNPDERYQSAREIADVLANCEEQFKAHAGLKDFARIPAATTKPAQRWKRIAAMALIVPLLAFGLYAINRPGAQPKVVENDHTNLSTPDPNKLHSEPVPKQITDHDTQASDRWVQLFNGKDLTGWKTHPEQPGNWEVKDGILKGSTRHSHLFSERGDYKNFHLRAEVKINLGGDSGILFRAPFELRQGRLPTEFGIPGCYEVELHQNLTYRRPIGTISEASGQAPPTSLGRVFGGSITQPDEWFTVEVTATNNRFISKLNGQETTNCEDPLNRHSTGHLALQVWNPNTVVQFRKIEIKELIASPPKSPPLLAKAPFSEADAEQYQKAWAKYLGVPVEKEISLGQDKNGKDVTLTMVLIPPGEFMIGATDEEQQKWLAAAKAGNPNAKPDAFATIGMEDQRFVRITKPFWLSKLEFTTGQFRRFVESTDYQTDAETNGKGAVRPAAGKGFERLPKLHWDNWGKISVDAGPVVNVSWNDAVKCCEWLSSQHPHMTFSLPTEAQWEFACRAGTKNSLYDCDTTEELREYAQFGDEVHFIQRGGQLRPNAFGLYDMLGNVSEWCSNWLAGHAMSPTDDPAGPAIPGKYEMRAIRGGSFVHKVWHVRSSKRDFYVPDDCSFDRGFRVAAAIANNANPGQPSAKANVADTPSAATEPPRPE